MPAFPLQCDFSEDEVSCCEKSFSHDSNDEDDLEENVEAEEGRLSGLNGTEVEDPVSEGKRKEEDTTHPLKGECSPGPEIQDTTHLNGHVLHESGRISGLYTLVCMVWFKVLCPIPQNNVSERIKWLCIYTIY